MDYESISREAEKLNYREKLQLAQQLIQLARKEEQEQNPEERAPSPSNPELIEYVVERLRKMRPSKRSALLNSIGAMFQFQGGVSKGDKEKIVSELLGKGHISITENDRIEYSEQDQVK